MRLAEYRNTGRPKKLWMDCVRNYICIKGVNTEMTTDRKSVSRTLYL